MTGRPNESIEELRAALIARGSSQVVLGDLDRIYALARDTHEGQVRRSGDPYVHHPIAVAILLAEWGLPIECVFAGLLHDLPEVLTDLSAALQCAGPTVVALVQAVAALDQDGGRHLMEEGRRLSAFDRQVAAIKIADRLHNARTWQYVPRQAASQKAAETVDILVPIARSLGLRAAGSELLDRSNAILAFEQVILGPATELTAIDVAVASGELGRMPARLLNRAVALLPPQDRARFADEWRADLAYLSSPRERIRLAIGLVYSAMAIRRATTCRRLASPGPRRTG